MSARDEQMREVVRNQVAHVRASHAVDRRDWTPQQWVDDARRLMGDLDGSVLDLVNGHVIRMLDALVERDAEIERLQASERQARSVIILHQQNGCGVQLDAEGLRVEIERLRERTKVCAERYVSRETARDMVAEGCSDTAEEIARALEKREGLHYQCALLAARIAREGRHR